MKKVICLSIIILIVSACSPAVNKSTQTAEIESETTQSLPSTWTPDLGTPTHTRTPWRSTTAVPTNTQPPTLTPTLTRIPPDPAISGEKIVNLLETNGGCELPCWWGFEVGITTWEEIESELGPYAFEIHQRRDRMSLLFHVPEYLSLIDVFGIGFTISSQGVVEEIDPNALGWQISRYSLASVLRRLGEPTEVWLIAGHRFTNSPFSITLYYASYGIQLIYSGIVRANDKFMLICPTMIFDYENPNMLIWRPDLYSSLVEKFGIQEDMYKIEDITEMTISEFYSLYSKNSSRCIEMPIKYSDS